MPGQSTRKKSVRQKLNAIAHEFEGKNVLIVDDSIVRGTTSREIVQMARDSGARKVYFASAAPPVRYPNVYGIDMPTRDELIASGRSDDQIAAEIGVDRLVYQDIESLHRRYRDRGFTVLAFPSNDFLQETRDEAGIAQMCQMRGYTYPMFARTHVRGGDQAPLYRFLTAATGETPPWNFGKYLIDRQGRPLAYFGPFVEPDDPALIRAIESALEP